MDKAIEVHALFQRNGPPFARNVLGLEPPRELLRVLDCRAEGKHLRLRVDLAQLRKRHLQRRPTVRIVDEMHFVGYDHAEPLEPVCAVTEEGVCALGGCDDDVEFLEGRVDRIVVADRNANLDSEGLEIFEGVVLFCRECTQWDDIQALPTAENGGEDGEVGDEGLAAGRRDREDEIFAEQGRPDRVRLRRIELLDPLFLQDLHDSGIEPEVRDTHPSSDAERSA